MQGIIYEIELNCISAAPGRPILANRGGTYQSPSLGAFLSFRLPILVSPQCRGGSYIIGLSVSFPPVDKEICIEEKTWWI
jgi:hypothetical protein